MRKGRGAADTQSNHISRASLGNQAKISTILSETVSNVVLPQQAKAWGIFKNLSCIADTCANTITLKNETTSAER